MKPPTNLPRILDAGAHATDATRVKVELLRDPASDHPVDYTAWVESVMRVHAVKRATRRGRGCT